MKFKKLLISASAIAAGSGLLATVLTSCAKSSIDDKLKITLDDNGLLYKTGKLADKYKLSYTDAVVNALTRSNTWGQFKNALADEIVFQWFENRMATSKTADDKNTNFRTSYDEWEYQINKDYNNTVQNCKNKYGANWEFYLQNEYLAPYGGTEATYKHAKMVEKVKADFISKVFAKNYFGYLQETVKSTDIYPHIYAKASKDVNKNTLRNPDNWGNIGFFARAELSFDPGEKPASYNDVKPNDLAKHPDGDYAAIQDYVFNRWFKTEKPFFASAALFKYSNPKYAAGGKLDQIYDATRTGVKIPTDKPSEAFPFFGLGENCSTLKAKNFLADVKSGKFAGSYVDGTTTKYNGTITIPLADSDDGQTCLLVCGNQMFSSLFTPYAMAAGNLYDQMMHGDEATSCDNTLTEEQVTANLATYNGKIDDFALLSNFFYNYDPSEEGTGTIKTINSTLDLNKIYGGLKDEGLATEEYHCPIFLECPTYKHFYGDSVSATKVNGIRYITNTIQVNDFCSTKEGMTDKQPWIMELNEAGIHFLTIDSYNYVAEGEDEEEKLDNLKKAVMFRLMQKQISDDGANCISTDLLGESGKLKTYFNDNFTNIVLELAMYGKDEATQFSKYNVFRKIESYKTEPASTVETDLFLYNIWKNESLGSTYSLLTDYINSLIDFENLKKTVSTLETANNKIYSYRSKQVTNSKTTEEYSKTIFENGLLAPFVFAPVANDTNNWMYDYQTVNRVVIQGEYAEAIENGAWNAIKTKSDAITDLTKNAYVADVKANAKVNGSTGFSPQIADAKAKASNRFWYKSGLVDKVMYSFMGNKAVTANGIKKNTYDYYIEEHDKDNWLSENGKIFGQASAYNSLYTTHEKSKVLSGDKTLAQYISKPSDIDGADDYYTCMHENFESILNHTEIENGIYADDLVNERLFYATVMYLIGNEDTTKTEPFGNFYTILNSKIGDDEQAIVGYLTRGYTAGTHTLTTDETTIGGDTDYDFNPSVDNLFDLYGYTGESRSEATETQSTNTKPTSSSYWTVIQKTLNGTDMDFAGFLGLQTKASNQLDSASELQGTIFGKFAKAIYGSHDLNQPKSETTQYEQNHGCWFQFAGQKNTNGDDITFSDFTYGDTTVKCNDWFPISETESENYGQVRKVAKKIIEWGTMDDLRALAKTLADSYDGYSYFSAIADGSEACKDADEMRMKMLKLLPSKGGTFEHQHNLNTFLRVKNAEAHTAENQPSYVFKDTKGNSYKLLLTQINKADAIEKRLTPTWDDTEGWVQGDSPITPEEFWAIFFQIASESTVQQRAITDIVKYAYGDEKLIVYDAQLYNQFDSVWIKDWTKKTMGA